MARRSSALLLWPVIALPLVLAGCDEAEQGRILHYEKGVYLGPADTKLDQETIDELRQRARLQQGS